MTASVRASLSPEVAEHCWVGGIHGNLLVIMTDSSSWTVPIRYQQHEYLKQLNTEYQAALQQKLSRLKIKVSTHSIEAKNSSSPLYYRLRDSG